LLLETTNKPSTIRGPRPKRAGESNVANEGPSYESAPSGDSSTFRGALKVRSRLAKVASKYSMTAAARGFARNAAASAARGAVPAPPGERQVGCRVGVTDAEARGQGGASFRIGKEARVLRRARTGYSSCTCCGTRVAQVRLAHCCADGQGV
jgi:hypothetical protein